MLEIVSRIVATALFGEGPVSIGLVDGLVLFWTCSGLRVVGSIRYILGTPLPLKTMTLTMPIAECVIKI